MSKTLCIDFDGVIHSYTSGWKGPTIIADDATPGAIDWLEGLVCMGYDVCIYSSRSKEAGAIDAMRIWLRDQGMMAKEIEALRFPTEKPAAYLTIDDRAICFRGTFPSQLEIESFKPWNKN